MKINTQNEMIRKPVDRLLVVEQFGAVVVTNVIKNFCFSLKQVLPQPLHEAGWYQKQVGDSLLG